MAPISFISQPNFGIWYLKLLTDTPAMFAYKKYLYEIGARRIVNYSCNLVVS